MFESIKQLSYPRSFRINAPGWPNPDKLTALINEMSVTNASGSEISNPESNKLLGDIATLIWRLEKRADSEAEPSEKVRRIKRDVEAAADFIRQGELEIKEHTGDIYDGGMRIKVIAFQKMSGLTREVISETIKPTVYYKGKLLQIGEVIVGVPQ